MKVAKLIFALGLAATAFPAYSIVISDGDFSGWSLGSSGTATVTREDASGNPGARLAVETVSGSLAFGTAIDTAFSTQAALEGTAFSLSLDVLSWPGAWGQGQRIDLLIEQNASVYNTFVGITDVRTDWETVDFSGTLTAASFSLLSGSGTTPLDLGGGVDTRFGFAAGNSSSGTYLQYYDNFRLDLSGVSSIPAPPVLGLMLAGLLGAWMRLRP